MLLDIKSKIPLLILCVVLIICCPLHVISRYGNQKVDYISQAELMGADFFHDSVSEGYVFGSWSIGVMKDIDKYRQINLEWVDWENIDLLIAGKTTEDMPFYVSISRQDEKRHGFIQGNTAYTDKIKDKLNNNKHFTFIYNNPDLVLYIVSA